LRTLSIDTDKKLNKDDKKAPKKILYLLKLNKYYYFLLLPGLVYYIIFRYGPLFGMLIAFKDYKLSLGVFGSQWSGLKWFTILFSNADFWTAFRNTLIISIYKMIFTFPVPIILALLLNEVKSMVYKKTIQTIVYLPYFISWVVISGIMFSLLSPSTGLLGLFGLKTSPLMQPESFRGLLVLSQVWKEAGWGTVIFLAAISMINPSLYEAAIVDGASRLKQIIYITLPCISSTIVILLILRTGSILSAGFDQIFVLYNPSVYNVSDILDTYVYRVGLTMGRYSLASAAGLFQSVVGCILLFTTNWISKKMGEEAIW
jgi:putative aldouronate transport system permease protein